MHELSLAESLIDVMEDEAKKQHFLKVRKLFLEIGALSSVDPEALRFGFECAAQGTLAEGAALEVTRVPGEAWCLHCHTTITLSEYGEACPHCHGWQLHVTGGQQFQLISLEVE